MIYYDAVDKEEKGIFTSVTDKYEAEEWLNRQDDRFLETSVRYGMHIVEREVVTLSEIGKIATDLVTLEDWHEDDSICFWCKFPIGEEPYVSSKLDVNFPNDVTHYTRIIIPKEPSK